MFTLTHRPLTPAEAQCVCAALRATPNILGYTASELTRLSDVFVAEAEGGAFAGLCFSVNLAGNWTEIAALLVLPEFRGRGIGRALFSAAWARAWARGRHVYVLSRNPQVVGWMEARGMTITNAGWKAPLAVHRHMARHLASRYRWAEAVRKRRAIAQCPPLKQGLLKFSPCKSNGT